MAAVARYPLFVYDMSDHPHAQTLKREKTEAKHFSPWWGGIIRYQFDHPVVHDTCWLHDLTHRATIKYRPQDDFATFSAKMLRHERDATITSNFAVYLDSPALRETIPWPLLVDRFLEDPTFVRYWNKARERAWAELHQFLAEASMSANPHDVLKNQIYTYGRTNHAWLGIWRERYTEIERHMALFHEQIDSGAAWGSVCAPWQAWLYSAMENNDNDIPFFSEAVAFSQAYLTIYPS